MMTTIIPIIVMILIIMMIMIIMILIIRIMIIMRFEPRPRPALRPEDAGGRLEETFCELTTDATL